MAGSQVALVAMGHQDGACYRQYFMNIFIHQENPVATKKKRNKQT